MELFEYVTKNNLMTASEFYTCSKNKEDGIAYVKWINANGRGTWFISEIQDETIAFGKAHITDLEFGYFDLQEMIQMETSDNWLLKKDENFEPKKLSDISEEDIYVGKSWQEFKFNMERTFGDKVIVDISGLE